MANRFPSAPIVWQAINIYLKQAYDGPPPLVVRNRLEKLREQPAETFYDSPALESDPQQPLKRYCLRLGNRCYPHMKLSVETAGDGSEFFFKADTHDQHCCPPRESSEYQHYLDMAAGNESLSKKIESEWAAAGIPTFREFLRNDLARRVAALAGSQSPGS